MANREGWMSYRLIRAALGLILGVAGVVHLVSPALFLPAMPPYIPWHLELIYLTGVLELAAAVGLRSPRFRRVTAWCLVAYFLAILPAHVHVAWNQVELFGIRDPRLLWGRLAFQPVFVASAYWLTREREDGPR
jgi:uncharacterized membrane protein